MCARQWSPTAAPPREGLALVMRATRRHVVGRAAPLAVRQRLGQAGKALVDQLLSSGTQLLLMVLVARQTDATTFGAVSIALLAHGFLLGVVRAAIGEVVLLRCRADPSSERHEASRGLFLVLVAGGAATAGLLACGAVVGDQVGHYLMVVAAAAPLVYAQDLLRYVAYGNGRVEQAVAIDGTWLGVQVIGSTVLLALTDATPTGLLMAWIAGAGAGALLGVRRCRVRARPVAVATWWVEERARAGGFLSDFLVVNGVWQATFLLVGVVLSLEELAGLRVALLAVSPLANLLAGVRMVILSHLAGLRARPALVRQRAMLLALGLAGGAAVYGAGLVVMPDRWGAELFGDSWAEASTLLAIIAVAEVIRLPTFAAVDLVKVLGGPTDLLRTRARGSIGVVTAMLLGAILAGPSGAALGTVVGNTWNQLVWWRHGSALSRRPTVQAEPVTL